MKRSKIVPFIAACLLGLTVFLSFYKLTESPPTWFDEGIITQTAIAIVQHGPAASLMVAPHAYVSGWYVTTGYTVTVPIALSFWFFGIGLLQARAIMALFIVAFAAAAYVLARKEMQPWLAVGSLALVATFAPLYGNGKNVLGEVPGLLFVALFLWCVSAIERGAATWRLFLLAGVLFGLAVVTKPLFLLLLPAAGLVLLFSRQLLTVQKVGATLLGFAAAFLLWVGVQFGGSSVGEVLGHYVNPNGVATGSSVVSNVHVFLTQPEPLYALLVLVAWVLSLAVRLWYKRPISRSEWIAALFALLIYAAYLRTVGFYRYFFVGEMLALAYLPLSLDVVFTRARMRFVGGALVALLVCFQTYQIFFHSWVADHYDSNRAAMLEALRELPQNKTIFLYNTPEAAVFLPQHMEYYQYLDITKKLQVGRKEIVQLSLGVSDFALIQADASSTIDLSHYGYVRTVDRYSLWYKK